LSNLNNYFTAEACVFPSWQTAEKIIPAYLLSIPFKQRNSVGLNVGLGTLKAYNSL